MDEIEDYIYRTRAIITRSLYIFYLIFYCGLYTLPADLFGGSACFMK